MNGEILALYPFLEGYNEVDMLRHKAVRSGNSQDKEAYLAECSRWFQNLPGSLVKHQDDGA